VDDRALAAIDIGTNSIHLIVVRPTGNNRFEVIDREKEVVRLGSGSGDMKTMSPDAMDRAVDTLARFRRVAAISDAEIRAVATSAVREAENREEFLARAQRDADVHVEVISGAEEARLIHLGVLQAVPAFDVRHLVIDIGGGSTEFVVGDSGAILEARSVKLGAIRLTDHFLGREPIRKRDVEEAREYIRSYLTPVAARVRALGFAVVIGSSGTILNLAEMVRARAGAPSPLQASNASFSTKELAEVVADLAGARTVAERLQLPGVEAKRADILLGGALVLEQAAAAIGFDEIVTSDFALREGVVLDVLQRRNRASIGHLRDLRYESVLHLAALCPEESEHAAHSTDLAVELFEATRDRHGLHEMHEEYLEAAGLLCNVGLFLSHDRHHLHSYYIIRNSELLMGFTDHEIELIAQVARYHRKSAPKPRHPEFARLSEADQAAVRILAGILRIGIALDRTRARVVRDLSVNDSGDVLHVLVDADGDASLELYTADARKGLLEEALGVPVELTLAN
jgi:exopolyphosphatase/guanosine-5'-triphosphate,3'-diphosphate pyrophosphatase